jgi:hypothetical protein
MDSHDSWWRPFATEASTKIDKRWRSVVKAQAVSLGPERLTTSMGRNFPGKSPWRCAQTTSPVS